jgi:diaminohydroxyphosphoribosylaminopyrimidine deaminase/5-amino-6-(5-phosphoribosylamino)uracil reductase
MEIDYLKLAIDEAWKYQLLTYPNPAVGCVVTIKNRVFVEAHKKAGEAHAEVNALWSVYKTFFTTPDLKTSHEIHEYLIKNHNNFFNDAEIFVTLEPCSHIGKTPSCANLLSILKPKKVTIGWLDPISTHSGGVEKLKNSGIKVEILNDKRCFNLIEPFIKWANDKFLFFKFATSLNGAYTGGYITKKESLKWVHKVRNKLDLIVIGGETIRKDRPTLDARLINGKAPDVLIYSKQKEFDKTIPLFSVENRKVFISDNLDLIKNYNFIMFEGGENLYQKVKQIVDWNLFIININKILDRKNYKFDDELEVIHVEKKEDLFLWGKCNGKI